jgi:ribosomal protein L21E
MNIQDISKDLLTSVSSIIEKKNVKEVDEPKAKGEKDFKDLHTKNVKVHTEKKKNECTSEKDFKPHMMYDPKTGKGYEAKTYDDHVRMDKMGYTHEKPEVKEVDEPTAKGEKDFKDLHTKNVKVHTESIDEGADKDVKGDKEAYQKFFQGMLKKFGVKSPAELSADKEKEFYDAIDAGWKADDEKKESIEEEISLDEGMKMVNKKTGKDVTKHVNDFLSGKIDRETFEKRAGLTPKDRKQHWLDTKKESIEEMKEPFIVIDTADKNKVVGTASDEKGAERIISSSERPPISIKDKKTLKIVKSNKKQNVGFPLKEAATNAFYRTTRIHLALRNAGLKPNDAKKVTDALKIIYGGGSEYKGSEVENVVRAVIGDSMGRKLAAKTIEQLHDLSRSVTQKWGFNEAKSATGYEIYHKDFSTAMQHAYDFAKKKLKVEVDPKEIDREVAMGPKRPSSGKTNSYRLKGKGGAIQVQVYNTGKSYELNMYKESVKEETLEERPKSMDPKKRLKIFNELKKGDKIAIAYDTPIAKADIYKDGELIYREFTVTRNKTVVGKARVEKITLAKDNVKSGVKFFLYNRDGKVSMAIGDLAAVIVDMKKLGNKASSVLKNAKDMKMEGVATNDELIMSESAGTLNESTEIYVGKGYKILRYAAGAGKTAIAITKDGSRSDYVDVSLDEFEMLVDVFKKLGNKASSVLKNAKDMKIQEPIKEAVLSMDKDARLKIFNDLKKGDKVQIKYNDSIRKGKDYQNFTVTRNKSVVGKARVEKITLAKDGSPGGVKFFLYNRDGSVSFAIGDMASVIVDMKKM